jgi:hypothetical protein
VFAEPLDPDEPGPAVGLAVGRVPGDGETVAVGVGRGVGLGVGLGVGCGVGVGVGVGDGATMTIVPGPVTVAVRPLPPPPERASNRNVHVPTGRRIAPRKTTPVPHDEPVGVKAL